MLPRFPLARFGLPGAFGIAALVVLAATGPVRAQVFFHTWSERFVVPLEEPAPFYRFERPARLPAALILEELAHRGFRDLVVKVRRPDLYVIEGVSPRSGPVRLVVDAFDGEILQRDALERLPRRPPRTTVTGQDRQGAIRPAPLVALPKPPVRQMPDTPAAVIGPPVTERVPILPVPVAPLL